VVAKRTIDHHAATFRPVRRVAVDEHGQPLKVVATTRHRGDAPRMNRARAELGQKHDD
jgi:hypothetical protein